MNTKILKYVAMICMLLVASGYVVAITDLLALQGYADNNGVPINNGNLTITIWDSPIGGAMLFNSSDRFFGAINGGRFDVTLGEQDTLSLEYGRLYYVDMIIDGQYLNFNGSARKIIQSSVGNITSVHIAPNSISSASIIDNSIVDEDINSIADINKSKISTQDSWLMSEIPTLTSSWQGTLDASRIASQDLLNVNNSQYLQGFSAAQFFGNDSAISSRLDFVNSTIAAKLNSADQRYNETALVNAKASPANCPAGQLVENTTTAGVQCRAITTFTDTNDTVALLSQVGKESADNSTQANQISELVTSANNLSNTLYYINTTIKSDTNDTVALLAQVGKETADNSTQSSQITTLTTSASNLSSTLYYLNTTIKADTNDTVALLYVNSTIHADTNDTAALLFVNSTIAAKLNSADQRYNETALVNAKASPGNCPSGKFVVNTTTGGVNCDFLTEIDPLYTVGVVGINNNISIKLNETDQRYNDTAYVDNALLNIPADNVKLTDNAGYYANDTAESSLEQIGKYEGLTGSSGLISGGTINSNPDGTINISAGVGYIRNSSGIISQVSWNAINNYGSFVNGNQYAIYIDSAGSPYLSSDDTLSDKILIGGVYNMNGVIFKFNDINRIDDINHRQNMYAMKGIGSVLEDSGFTFFLNSNNLTMANISSGRVYHPDATYNAGPLTYFTVFFQNGIGNWTPLVAGTNVINRTAYNPSGALATLTSGYWKKDVILVDFINNQAYYVLGQEQFATREEAISGELPQIPSLMTNIAVYDVAILSNGTEPVLGNIIDIRPSFARIFGFGSVSNGISSASIDWDSILNKPYWASAGYSATGNYLHLDGSAFSVDENALDTTFTKGSGTNQTLTIWTDNKTLGDSPIIINPATSEVNVNEDQFIVGSTNDVTSPQNLLLGSDIPAKASVIDGTDNDGRGFIISQDGKAVWDMSVYENEDSKYLYLGYNYRSGETAFTVTESGRVGVNKQDNILEYHTGFNGTGLDDAEVSGTYLGKAPAQFEVQAFSPTQFKWRMNYDNRGFESWSSPVTINGAAQELDYGAEITFPSSGNYTPGDTWYFTAFSANPSGSFTISSPAYTEALIYNGTIWNDMTYEAGTSGGMAFVALQNTQSYIYFARTVKFGSAEFVLKTPGVGLTNVVEYWNGNTWVALSGSERLKDTTNGLTLSGSISWDTSLFTWENNVTVEDYPSSNGYYWMRVHTTTTPSTAPEIYTLMPQGINRFSIFNSPYDTTPAFYVTPTGDVVSTGTFTAPNLASYNDSAAIALKLDVTDQRYNDTASISTVSTRETADNSTQSSQISTLTTSTGNLSNTLYYLNTTIKSDTNDTVALLAQVGKETADNSTQASQISTLTTSASNLSSTLYYLNTTIKADTNDTVALLAQAGKETADNSTQASQISTLTTSASNLSSTLYYLNTTIKADTNDTVALLAQVSKETADNSTQSNQINLKVSWTDLVAGIGNWTLDKSSYKTVTASDADNSTQSSQITTLTTSASNLSSTLYYLNTTIKADTNDTVALLAQAGKETADNTTQAALINTKLDIPGVVTAVGNWSDDKTSYSTTAQANVLYEPNNVVTFQSMNITRVQTSRTDNVNYTVVVNLSLTLAANSVYEVECNILNDAAAATTGVQLRVNTTGSPTSAQWSWSSFSSAAAVEAFSGANAASNAFADSGSSTTISLGNLNGLVVTAGSSSVMTVEMRSEITLSAARIEPGSFCRSIKIQ